MIDHKIPSVDADYVKMDMGRRQSVMLTATLHTSLDGMSVAVPRPILQLLNIQQLDQLGGWVALSMLHRREHITALIQMLV